MSGEIELTVVGNLTADPELRFTQSGLAVVNFTIASTPQVWDRQASAFKDGEPTFLRCSAWREFAENIAASLRKGTRVIAKGVYKQRRYQTESGENRTSSELEVGAIGPDLRWASANVTRTTPGGQRTASAADVWSAPAFSLPPSSGTAWDDETPF